MIKQQTLSKPVNKFLNGSGRISVTATFNNTIVTIADDQGRVVCWGAAGLSGFKGARKATPFAATTTIEQVVNKAKNFGLVRAKVYIKGPGPGRDAVLRVLRGSHLKIIMIADVTPMPHNGCRPKKRRRV